MRTLCCLLLSLASGLAQIPTTGVTIPAGQTLTIEGSTAGNASGFTNIAAFPFHVSTNNGATDVYYPLGQISNANLGTANVYTNGNIRLYPFWNQFSGVVDSMAMYVNGASAGNLRFGIFNTISVTNLFPGTLLFGTGTFDTSTTGPKTTNLVTPVRLYPGVVYWAASQMDNATATVRGQGTAGVGVILGMNTNFVSNFSLEVAGVGFGTFASPMNLLTNSFNPGNTYLPAINVRFKSL